MNNEEFRALLDWFMCSDPWPESVPRTIVIDWITKECAQRGYDNWVVAYHEFAP